MQKQYRVTVMYPDRHAHYVTVNAADVLEAEAKALIQCPGAHDAMATQWAGWVPLPDHRPLGEIVEDAPHKVRAIAERDANTATARHASRFDTLGHSSVQPWSAGEFFPAVLGRVERYRSTMTKDEQRAMRAAIGYADEQCWLAGASLESRLECVTHTVTYGSRTEEYATREDAEVVAKWIAEDPRLNGGAFIGAREV
jgi:hypothetical protein